jgi:hypothetical protein
MYLVLSLLISSPSCCAPLSSFCVVSFKHLSVRLHRPFGFITLVFLGWGHWPHAQPFGGLLLTATARQQCRNPGRGPYRVLLAGPAEPWFLMRFLLLPLLLSHPGLGQAMAELFCYTVYIKLKCFNI